MDDKGKIDFKNPISQAAESRPAYGFYEASQKTAPASQISASTEENLSSGQSPKTIVIQAPQAPPAIIFKTRNFWISAGALIGLLAIAFGWLMVTTNHQNAQNNQVAKSQDLIAQNIMSTSPSISKINLNRDTTITGGKSLTATGQVAIQNEADSQNAFMIQNASGKQLLVADTANQKIGVGTAPQANGAVLQVGGDISSTGQLLADGGTSSLSNSGLKINSVLICDTSGCIAKAGTGSASLTGNQTFSGANQFNNLQNKFAGNGSSLINVNAVALNGQSGGFYTNAGNLSSGVLDVNRLPAAVAFLNKNNNFTGSNSFASINSSTIFQNGSQVCDASGNCTYSSSQLSDSSNIAKLNANQIFTGSNTFQSATDSTTAFQIQNANGTSHLFEADTVNARIAIAQPTASYTLDVGGDINSTTGLYVGGNLVCNSTGCTTASGSGDYIQNGTTLQTANYAIQSANPNDIVALIRGASGQSASLLQLVNGDTGNVVASVANSGAALFKNDSDSTTAFQVQSAGGANVLAVDTTDQRVNIGGLGTATGQLFVGGSLPKNVSGGGVTTGGDPMEIAIQGHYAYVVSQLSNKLQVFDISNPSTPVDVSGGGVATNSGPFDVYVQSHYAYVVTYSTNSTLQVFDISNPSAPIDITAGGVSLRGHPVSVIVSGHYAYVDIFGNNQLQVFDVSNPSHPTAVSVVNTASGPERMFISGRYLYLPATFDNKLQVFDISNPSVPVDVSGGGVATDTSPADVYVIGRYAYLISSSPGMLQVFDISNPALPVDVTAGGVATVSNPNGISVQGQYAYVVGFTMPGKLQVFDISNPSTPVDVSGGGVATLNQPIKATINGRYAYIDNEASNKLQVFDLGGTYSQQLEAGGAEIGTLNVVSNASFAGGASISGGLQVGQSAQISGSLATSGNLFVQGTTSLAGALLGGVSINSLSSPGAPTITQQGTAGSTNYSYSVTAISASGGEATASAIGSTSTGNATLDTNNYNQLTWPAVSGAVAYKVYRTASAGTPSTTGLIGTAYGGYFNDTGLVGSGSSPTVNTTGNFTAYSSQTLFKPATDNTTAFQVQNASGGSLIKVDSSNSIITLDGNTSGQLGQWIMSSNNLPSILTSQTTVVANGYIYAIGGCTPSCSPGSANIYYAKLNADGSTGAWQTSPNTLPTGISAASSITANGYLYVIGGINGSSYVATVYYSKLNADGSTGVWRTTSSLPGSRGYAYSTSNNGYVYVIGGFNGSAFLTSYYAKLNSDGTLGAWGTTSSLPTARYWGYTATANGYIYVIGSSAPDSTVYYAKFNSDGSLSGWTTSTNPLPVGMQGTAVVTSNGYIYILGSGTVQTIYYAKLDADGSTGAWQTNINNAPITSASDTATLANGYVYILGGAGNKVYYASTSRVQVGANLDLVGLQGGTTADAGGIGQGSTGGSITAGNITAVGGFQVQGQANFAQGVGIGGNLSVAGDTAIQTTTNSTTSFQVQNSGGFSLFTVDTTDTEVNIGHLGSLGLSTTVNIANNNGAAQTVYIGGTGATGGSSSPSTYINIQAGNTNMQLVNSGLTLKTFNNSSKILQVQNSGGSNLLAIDATGNGNITIGNATNPSTITFTGGVTVSRPATPTKGTLFYDTSTNQLVQYNGSKWQAPSKSNTFIVAASNSTQAEKDAADAVASGSADQTTINSFFTSTPCTTTGCSVYLMEGTYTISGSINVPDNTTLSGAGTSTIITIPNAQNGTYSMITNSDTTTGTNVTIQNLLVDGNKANQTAGSMTGIYFNKVGSGSGSSARSGGKIANTQVRNLYGSSGYGIELFSSSNNIISGSTIESDAGPGIYIYNTSSNNTITGNTVQGNGTEGVFIYLANNNNVSANTVQGNSLEGIYMNNSAGNTVTGNTSQGNYNGVRVSGASSTNNTISGNTISNSTNYGINISASSNIISSNKIYDSGGVAANNGIYIWAGVNQNSIVDNDITDSSCTTTCYAINVAAGTNNYLASNHFVGDGTNSASISDTGTNTIYSGQQLTQNGDTSFRNAVDSASAFQVQNAAGTSLLTVDTSGMTITINGALNVAGNLTISSGSLITSSTSMYGTSLPASPVNGQEYYFVADATNGIVWHLRYNSTSGYWEYLGGDDLLSVNDTASTITSTTYADPANNVSITLPLAGDYDITLNATVQNPGGSNSQDIVAIECGSSATQDSDGIQAYSTPSGIIQITGTTSKRCTGALINDIVKVQTRYANVSGGQVSYLRLRVHPIRVH